MTVEAVGPYYYFAVPDRSGAQGVLLSLISSFKDVLRLLGLGFETKGLPLLAKSCTVEFPFIIDVQTMLGAFNHWSRNSPNLGSVAEAACTIFSIYSYGVERGVSPLSFLGGKRVEVLSALFDVVAEGAELVDSEAIRQAWESITKNSIHRVALVAKLVEKVAAKGLFACWFSSSLIDLALYTSLGRKFQSLQKIQKIFLFAVYGFSALRLFGSAVAGYSGIYDKN